MFEDALKRERFEVTEWKKMEQRDMDTGLIPADEVVSGSYSPGTTCALLQDMSGEE